MNRFVGKIAIVTGAASGIGAATARKLIENGIRVVGIDIQKENLQKLTKEFDVFPEMFYSLGCDVCKENEIHKAFQWVQENVGPISILVNSAGVLIRKSLIDIDEESANKIIDTNLKGVLLCSKEAVKMMIDQSIEGHIININSINGHSIRSNRNTISTTVVYAASKYGVTAVTEGMRKEIKQRKANIKCTSISPGGVMTELNKQEYKEKPTPMEQLSPEDVANACISVLNTPPNVLVSELTVMALHQS